jgi:hypothetical protein
MVIAPQAAITGTLISLNGNRLHDLRMEDVYSTRRKNLQHLCVERHEGNQSAMGRALGIEPNLVNRWLRGTKQIGPEVARDVEKNYKLEKGWMDHVHPSDEESALIEAYRNATDDRRTAVKLLLELQAAAPNQGLSRSRT